MKSFNHEQLGMMLKLRHKGLSWREIAKKFNTTHSTIRYWLDFSRHQQVKKNARKYKSFIKRFF